MSIHPLLAVATVKSADAAAEKSSSFDFAMIWQKIVDVCTTVGMRLLGAILLLVIGLLIIKLVMKALKKSKFFSKADATVARFLLNFIRITMYVILVVAVIGILGVPLTSVVTVIASAGVAIGLALQGALSNFAGGIMILLFRPFKVENYVSVAGMEGTVEDIDIFYTTLITVDNKVVTIPNGTVMANSIVNFSGKDTRRVDLVFNVAKDVDVAAINAMLLDVAANTEKALQDPAPFAHLSGQTDSAKEFTFRVWCNTADYWDVYFALKEAVNARFVAEGVVAPNAQLDVHVENKK